ncbi:MAG TPA: peptidoglycan-binding protein [Hyphomicrobiaceae bacterium]|nr:peptidoglycan-binding protein [Hyphomicrobiaceae bacterium]
MRRTLAYAALGAGVLGLVAGWPPVASAWKAGIPGGGHIATLVQPVAVFGKDDRTHLPAKYRALREKIGLLFNLRSRTVCTAFCVAPDIIATASHCLFSTAGERAPRLADFWFARNYDAAREYARIAGHNTRSAAQHVMAGSTHLNVHPPIDATRDWALVRLARPICSKGVLAVRALPAEQIEKEAAAKRVFQISYHRDFTPWKPAYSHPCRAGRNFGSGGWTALSRDFYEPSLLVLHTCDTGGASSGSPLLLETAHGPEVIGINVGTYVQSRVLIHDGQVTERLKADTVANTAVAAAAFAGMLDTFRHAAILSSRQRIRELQGALKKHGFYAGPADGVYGPELRRAIEAYERAQGLPATGLATQTLLKRLSGGAVRARS